MKLTAEQAQKYVGGQVEVHNARKRYLYRGEIATATVENGKLRLTLSWMAKDVGFPASATHWVNIDKLTHSCGLDILVHGEGLGRLELSSSIIGEVVWLYSPDGSKLDPSEVEGLFPKNIYPFFGGEILLVALAPDELDTRLSFRTNQPVWTFLVSDNDGHLQGFVGVRADVDDEMMWKAIQHVLYHIVSSGEVNRGTPEIKAWIKQVHEAYQARLYPATA